MWRPARPAPSRIRPRCRQQSAISVCARHSGKLYWLRAQAHIRQRSLSQALHDLTDPAGGFMDRDMYIFVLDPQGVYHAFGGSPPRSVPVQDVAGVDGADIIHRFNESMKFMAAGWSTTTAQPHTTGKVQPKMSYVVPLR